MLDCNEEIQSVCYVFYVETILAKRYGCGLDMCLIFYIIKQATLIRDEKGIYVCSFVVFWSR